MISPRGVSRETSPELPPLGEEIDFMRLIWALDHALQRTSKRMNATLGITGPQRLVIRIVGRFPGILPGQLASILHVHPSTVTGILERLARRGLLVRDLDPRDRRRARLGLTAKGRTLDIAATGTVEAAVSETLSSLAPAKIRDAAEVLAKLTAALEETAHPS
jgi:DNA-binding MarR family transcriptional regulator